MEANPKYIRNVINVLGLEESRPVSTPSVKRTPTTESLVELENEKRPVYKTAVGQLLYMCQERTDIMYCVKETARKITCPTESDEMNVNCIARYLKGVPSAKCLIEINRFPPFVNVYTDSDWARQHQTRKSTSGGVTQWRSTTLSARSRTQQSTSAQASHQVSNQITAHLVVHPCSRIVEQIVDVPVPQNSGTDCHWITSQINCAMMDVERDCGAARRRRERQIRSWLKHERQTVRIVLGRSAQNYALEGQKKARTRVATNYTPKTSAAKDGVLQMFDEEDTARLRPTTLSEVAGPRKRFCGASSNRLTSSCPQCRFSTFLCRRS